MNFEIKIISTQDYVQKYKRLPNESKVSKSKYVKLTEKQKEQKRADRAYHRNWKDSISMPKAKSQRLADLNNIYY